MLSGQFNKKDDQSEEDQDPTCRDGKSVKLRGRGSSNLSREYTATPSGLRRWFTSACLWALRSNELHRDCPNYACHLVTTDLTLESIIDEIEDRLRICHVLGGGASASRRRRDRQRISPRRQSLPSQRRSKYSEA